MVRYATNGDIIDGDSSSFNEAKLKMIRLHELQRASNRSSMNPLAYNEETATFNYEIVLSCCHSLIEEVWSKLSKQEKTEALEFKKKIDDLLNSYPPYENKKNVMSKKTELKPNKENWYKIEKSLFIYKLYVKHLLGQTGYDSPSFDIDDGL